MAEFRCAFSMKKEYPGVQDIHLMIDQFHKRYQEEIAKTKQQNEVLNKTLSDAKSQNASLQKQIDQLRKELEERQQASTESLERLAAHKNVFIKKLNEKVEKLKSKNEELTKKLEEIDNLNDEYLKQIGQPGFENRKLPIVDIIDRSKTKDAVIAKQMMQLNKAAQQERAFKAAYEKLKNDYEELSKTCDDYMKQYIFVEQERRKQQEINAMLDHNNAQLAKELDQYKKSNLSQVVELKRQISIMQSAIDSDSAQNKALEDIIRQQEKDHKAEVEKLKKKHGEEMAKLKQAYEAAMTDKIAQLKKEYDQNLIQQLDQQKAELDTNKLTGTICRLNKEILEYGNYIKKVKEQLVRAQENSRRISIRYRDLLLSLSVFSEKLESSSNQNLKNQWNDLVAPYLSNK